MKKNKANEISKKYKKANEFWNGDGAKNYLNNPLNDVVENSNYQFDILNRLGITSGEVLEIGPGTGRDMKRFNKLGYSLNAMDIAKAFIDNLSETLPGNFIVKGFREIKGAFKGIDLIYSRRSLFNITYQEFEIFLNDIVEVLSRNGHILVSMRAGDTLEYTREGTDISWLQMSIENLIKVLPKELEIIFSEQVLISSRPKAAPVNQFTFVLKRK